MPVTENLPASFAVIGQQLMGPPVFKFYKRTIIQGRVNHIEAASQRECNGLTLHLLDEDDFTPLVKCVCVPENRHKLWWSMPLYFEYADTIIPVVEFQYKAWLPVSHSQVSSGVQADLQRIYSRINTAIQDSIRNNESQTIRPPTPPRSRRSFSSQSNSDSDVPTTPPLSYRDGEGALLRRVERTPPPVRRPVRQQISSRQHFALPENIGALILRDSRSGEGECPITSTPYSDCEGLAVTSCFHVFDAQSISRWQQDHSTCPVCRAEIVNIVNE